MYRSYAYQLIQGAQAEQDDDREAIGIGPEQVSIRVSVSAAFVIP